MLFKHDMDEVAATLISADAALRLDMPLGGGQVLLALVAEAQFLCHLEHDLSKGIDDPSPLAPLPRKRGEGKKIASRKGKRTSPPDPLSANGEGEPGGNDE